jgi:hypothetical protein
VNLLALIPFPYRLLALALLAAALYGAGVVTGLRHGEAQREALQARWDAERQALATRVATQQADNAKRAADAMSQYTPQVQVRDRFIAQTITEIKHVTDPLASCPVPPDAVRMLNRAGDCAREDRPAACGADDQVRDPGPAP